MKFPKKIASMMNMLGLIDRQAGRQLLLLGLLQRVWLALAPQRKFLACQVKVSRQGLQRISHFPMFWRLAVATTVTQLPQACQDRAHVV